MKFGRSFWVLLAIGVALRCVALNQPLVDAHLLRQCQTAAATRSLIEESGRFLSSPVPWLGDLGARYVMEFPTYSYMVAGVAWLSGNLDVSGKLASILLWTASFVCLQFIWRRLLAERQVFWANLLFVLAPLSVFYGQAFMPEMLVQALAFAFVLLILRYGELPSRGRWSLCVATGIAGLLVKLPEFAHLYLILGYVLIRQEGWRRLFRPRYLVGAVITVAALKGWGGYVDSVNAGALPEWSAGSNLRGFIGPLGSRFQLRPWTMALLYVGLFILPGLPAFIVPIGLWRKLREPSRDILLVWIFSLVAFYLLWFGNGAVAQAYYNLPALAPLCALFGIGMSTVLGAGLVARWKRTAAIAAVALTLLPAVPAWRYLFQQDLQVLAAARWAAAHTQPTDVILFRPNHRWDFVDYPYNSVMAYVAGRPTFVWTGNTSEPVRQLALARATYAIVTLPPSSPATGWMARVRKLRGSTAFQLEATDWLQEAGFAIVAQETGFAAYQKK